MALNLTTLAGKLASVSVEFMGQSTKVTYDPMAITAENIAKAQMGGDDEFVDFFCKVVKNWDVTKGQKKVPITQKGLEGVPLPLLRAVYYTVLSDSSDNAESGKASSAG